MFSVIYEIYSYTVHKKKAKLPLSKTHPELAKEALGWDPELVTAGSNKKVLWHCSEGHQWEALISNRSRGRGCRECSTFSYSQRRINMVINRGQKLINTHPEIAAQLLNQNKFITRKLKTHSNVKLDWKCELGHIWPATVNNRVAGQGCTFCSGRKVLIGFNDLATTHPGLAQEAYGWDPKTLSFGSSKKLNWKCSLGHIWPAIVNLRSSQNTDCPVCTGKKLLVGFNDLATTHPVLAQEAYEWDPKTVSFGMSKAVRWKCTNNHIWKADVISRTPNYNRQKEITLLGTGCPSCSPHGFDPNSDAYLYFLYHSTWKMLQIGITNFPDNRIKSHKKLGWESLEIRGPMDGHLAQQWEKAILHMLKAKDADLSNSKIAGKFDGYSEAWSKSTFPVKSIKELMRLTEEFEEGK